MKMIDVKIRQAFLQNAPFVFYKNGLQIKASKLVWLLNKFWTQ